MNDQRSIISFTETHYPKFHLHQHISKFLINCNALVPENDLEQTFQPIIDKAVENTHTYYKKKNLSNRVKHIGILLNGYGLGNNFESLFNY